MCMLLDCKDDDDDDNDEIGRDYLLSVKLQPEVSITYLFASEGEV